MFGKKKWERLVQKGDKKEVIPMIQPGAAMEYAITTAIKKISVNNILINFITIE